MCRCALCWTRDSGARALVYAIFGDEMHSASAASLSTATASSGSGAADGNGPRLDINGALVRVRALQIACGAALDEVRAFAAENPDADCDDDENGGDDNGDGEHGDAVLSVAEEVEMLGRRWAAMDGALLTLWTLLAK